MKTNCLYWTAPVVHMSPELSVQSLNVKAAPVFCLHAASVLGSDPSGHFLAKQQNFNHVAYKYAGGFIENRYSVGHPIKKNIIEPLIVVLSTKTNILIRYFCHWIIYMKKVIQKLNLEEKGWGMNKGSAFLECVSFRTEIWSVLHYASELRWKKNKNRWQTEKVSKRRKPTECSIWFLLQVCLHFLNSHSL